MGISEQFKLYKVRKEFPNTIFRILDSTLNNTLF